VSAVGPLETRHPALSLIGRVADSGDALRGAGDCGTLLHRVRQHARSGQGNSDYRALTLAARNDERSTMQFGQSASEWQTEAGAFVSTRVIGLHLAEGLQRDFYLVRRHPRPCITHVERDAAFRVGAGDQGNPTRQLR
jgi:hypothetical protein